MLHLQKALPISKIFHSRHPSQKSLNYNSWRSNTHPSCFLLHLYPRATLLPLVYSPLGQRSVGCLLAPQSFSSQKQLTNICFSQGELEEQTTLRDVETVFLQGTALVGGRWCVCVVQPPLSRLLSWQSAGPAPRKARGIWSGGDQWQMRMTSVSDCLLQPWWCGWPADKTENQAEDAWEAGAAAGMTAIPPNKVS